MDADLNTLPCRDGDRCLLATSLAGYDVRTHDDACRACLREDRPQAANAVTASLIIGQAPESRRREMMQRFRHLLRRVDPAGPPPCVHRGGRIRDAICQTCGSKWRPIPVYHCAVHGECVVTSREAVERRADGSLGYIRSCHGCEDALPPDQSADEDETPETPHAGARVRRPRKLILRTPLPPGDVCTLTAAVESLHRTYPGEYITDVRTHHAAIWEHNPHVTPIDDDDPEVVSIDMHYPAINTSNQQPVTFVRAYTDYLAEQIGRPLQPVNRPAIYVSDEERTWLNQVAETFGHHGPFWIVSAGTKSDYTLKQWPVEYWHELVRLTRDRILWVQVGAEADRHPRIEGTLDLRGRTDLRQLIRLVYHCRGGVGPVTLLQHLCAAFGRPYVCLVGGREPAQWVQYPQQITLHTVGTLPCCRDGACWKSRPVPAGDGSDKDRSLCERPRVDFVRPVGECMARITPELVARHVLTIDAAMEDHA